MTQGIVEKPGLFRFIFEFGLPIYALWLTGSLIGYNAGFIQDYLVSMGNLC